MEMFIYLGAILHTNVVDKVISITNNNRTKYNFLIQNGNNNYLGFQPISNAVLKIFNHPDPDTVLKDRPEHIIVKLLKYENDTRHAIIFFTAKKIIFVKLLIYAVYFLKSALK